MMDICGLDKMAAGSVATTADVHEDLLDVWDTDFQQTVSDALRPDLLDQNASDVLMGNGGSIFDGLIRHDRLLTDSLGLLPPQLGNSEVPVVKTEHSYSMAGSDGDSIPDSPLSNNDTDSMESECYPCMPIISCTSNNSANLVKEEPLSPEDPSAANNLLNELFAPAANLVNVGLVKEEPKIETSSPSSSTVIRTSNVVLARPRNLFGGQRLSYPKVSLQIDNETRCGISATSNKSNNQSSNIISERHQLSSRSPTVIRHTASTASQNAAATTKVVFGHPPSLPPQTSSSTRHPIQTSLISSQPKGATGVLHLTEEEKRTLISEGYPVPQRLPLTKTEEKSLKKIRRKIKNKISAQESRRKKKEYMDCLEKRMHLLSDELEAFKQRYAVLEGQNTSLRSQLQQVQTQMANCHCIKTKDCSSIKFSTVLR